MRTLNRNKQTFYYALYTGVSPISDEYGNLTGEYESVYEKPNRYRANISAAKGETITEQFGESEGYDRVIVMDKNCPPIDEHTILWIDTLPRLDDNGALSTSDDGEVVTPHDYIVKKVAHSLNSVSVAIQKVKVQ